jgi:hypothetical protein
MTDSSAAFGSTPFKPKVLMLIILLIAVALILAWPITTVQTPLWQIRVVDEAGQPLEGMTVTLSYQNFSAESEGHLERKQTDKDGYVVFSQRSLKANGLRRIVTTLVSASAGVHASFGPHASVWADGNGLRGYAVSNGYVTDWTGAPLHMFSTIVAKPHRQIPSVY